MRVSWIYKRWEQNSRVLKWAENLACVIEPAEFEKFSLKIFLSELILSLDPNHVLPLGSRTSGKFSFPTDFAKEDRRLVTGKWQPPAHPALLPRSPCPSPFHSSTSFPPAKSTHPCAVQSTPPFQAFGKNRKYLF